MGLGSEVLFIFVLGVLLLGPKRLPAILGHVARARAQLRNAAHNFKSQLDAELETQSHNPRVNSRADAGEEQ